MCLESVCHALTSTRGQLGNGTNQIRIKSPARKSLGNSIKGKNIDKNLTEICFQERLMIKLPVVFLPHVITEWEQRMLSG